MAQTRKRRPDLEKSLEELETIVEELESGELSLEKSLERFEKGIRLSRECQNALKQAEQKVQMLVEDNLKDFDSDDVESDE